MNYTEQLVEYYLGSLEAETKMDRTLQAYWPRLSTRIIVTNSLEAHLREDAPKDVAVYYYVQGAPDDQLPVWRLAVLEAWLHTLSHHSPEAVVAGMSHGILQWRGMENPTFNPPHQARLDDILDAGYNPVRLVSFYGYIIWGDLLWRDGKLANPRTTDLMSTRNRAAPLSLLV